MALSAEIRKKIEEWTNAPYEKECIDEIKQLVADNNEDELNERFGADLEFGTGGLRGIIRNGTNGMNKYNVAKATQGLANYVLASGKTKKAAVAYDSRLYSDEFAKATAIVLASSGIKTYLFKELRPTPVLSYAVRYFGCTTGVVITASHNPKEYNGYKAYWNDGGQVIAPDDKNIIEEVRKIKTLNDVKRADYDQLIADNMIELVGEDFDEHFINDILKQSIYSEGIDKDVKIVYTPLHGTGGTMVPKALKKMGFNNIIYVEEQMKADTAFSTVIKPNPEEREALTMGIKLAEKERADIVIANDPDADRMGIAVKTESGEFEVVSGNHIGAIIEYYVLNERKKQNKLPENPAIVKTVVTTDLQDVIAEELGVKVFNQLTGFKYIAKKIRDFEKDGDYTFVCGGEESYGYLQGTHARDKDAIVATLMIAECCAMLKKDNRTLVDYLTEIFEKFGYYQDETISINIPGLKGKEVILSIMKHYRENPRTAVGGVDVAKAIDFLNDTVMDAENSSYELDKSNVLQYKMADGSKVTLRPSGTEPKIKFYFSTKGKSKQDALDNIKKFKDDLIGEVNTIIEKNS